MSGFWHTSKRKPFVSCVQCFCIYKEWFLISPRTKKYCNISFFISTSFILECFLMLHWIYNITSELSAWINYSSPCRNTMDALIVTDSQTRLYEGENTHQSSLSLWLHHVIAWNNTCFTPTLSDRKKLYIIQKAPWQLCESTQACSTQAMFSLDPQWAGQLRADSRGKYIFFCVRFLSSMFHFL